MRGLFRGGTDPLTDPDTGEPMRNIGRGLVSRHPPFSAPRRVGISACPPEVRVFAEGAPRIAGLVEVPPRVPRAQEFYVAFAAQAWAPFRSWAEGCPGWRLYGSVDGLPPGWQLGFAEQTREAGPAAVSPPSPSATGCAWDSSVACDQRPATLTSPSLSPDPSWRVW